jgi:hypothetical protein
VNFSKNLPSKSRDEALKERAEFSCSFLGCPLVGVVTDRCEMSLAEFEILKFATLADVELDPNA